MIETQASRVHLTEFPVSKVLNLEEKIGKESNDLFRPSAAERKFLTNPKILLENKHKVTQSKFESLHRAFPKFLLSCCSRRDFAAS